jgi:hypothetical protein
VNLCDLDRGGSQDENCQDTAAPGRRRLDTVVRKAPSNRDLGPDWLRRRDDEAHGRRLLGQLERLGHTVVLDPAA